MDIQLEMVFNVFSEKVSLLKITRFLFIEAVIAS
jgi:hypothetical protein